MMKFNLKALKEPINIMEKKLSKMTNEQREEAALKMWYGATQFKGVTIGLETVWSGIIKKTKKALEQIKEGKMTDKDLKKWKKFMLKKVYPNTEQSKPFRELIEGLGTNYHSGVEDVFNILLKDIEDSKVKAFEEHMKHWTGK